MHEYKVIPAPRKGLKAKGLKSNEDRFAHSLQELINTEAKAGWAFLRAETLPSEERSGFRARTTVYRSVLVFRKALQAAEDAQTPAANPAPRSEAKPEPKPEPLLTSRPATSLSGAPETDQDSSNAKA